LENCAMQQKKEDDSLVSHVADDLDLQRMDLEWDNNLFFSCNNSGFLQGADFDVDVMSSFVHTGDLEIGSYGVFDPTAIMKSCEKTSNYSDLDARNFNCEMML